MELRRELQSAERGLQRFVLHIGSEEMRKPCKLSFMKQLLSFLEHLVLSNEITVIRLQLLVLGFFSDIVRYKSLHSPLRLPILLLIVTHPFLYHHIVIVAAHHAVPPPVSTS